MEFEKSYQSIDRFTGCITILFNSLVKVCSLYSVVFLALFVRYDRWWFLIFIF